MNRFDLEKKLLEEGYDARSLFISKDIGPLDEGLLILNAPDGTWIAQHQERGELRTVLTGMSEDDVCQKIYKLISPKILRQKNNATD